MTGQGGLALLRFHSRFLPDNGRDAYLPLLFNRFPKTQYYNNERERSEDGPWPPGDIGGLVDAHGVTGVMV